MRSLFAATVEGRQAVVEYEPDAELRDTEQIPLQERAASRRSCGQGNPHADRD